MMIRTHYGAGLLLAAALLLQGCETTPKQPAAPSEPQQPPVTEEVEPAPPVVPSAEPPTAPEPPPTAPEVPEPTPLPQPAPVCEPAPPTPPPAPVRPAAPKTRLAVLGEVENLRIEPPGVTYRARLDTGRELSKLHAVDVREFERDGKAWVKFSLADGKEGAKVEVTRPVLRTVSGHGAKHYVISLKATIAGVSQFTDFMLVDRSRSVNQALIGRSFLRDQAVVDVGQRFTKPEKP